MINNEKPHGFFQKDEVIAVAGVSRNKRKFGFVLYDTLKKRGYKLLPINPNCDKLDDEKCYKSVSEIPDEVKRLIIVTNKSETDRILDEASKKGIKNIWIQQSSNSKNTLKIASEMNSEIFLNRCALMFSEPVDSVHKFHKSILKLFGLVPKQ